MRDPVNMPRTLRRKRPTRSRPQDAAPEPSEESVSRPPSVKLPESEGHKSLPLPSPNMSRTTLAELYEPFVRSIAGKIKKTLPKEIEYDDLLSYGMLGLFEAADRFDPKRGANFTTFAYYRIRGAIYDGLRGMGWVNRREYQRFRFEQRANAFLQNMEEQVQARPAGIKPSDDEQVEEMASVVEGLVTIFVTALDAMDGFEIADDAPSAQDSFEVAQARQFVSEALERMAGQERDLLRLYYYQELSLEEVGKELGLSKSWTSRLHTRAIQKLGRLLRELISAGDDDPPI